MTLKAGMKDNTDVLVVGTGYLGRVVAQMSRRNGQRVYATTRRKSRFDSLAADQLLPVQFDWTLPSTYRNLPTSQLSASPLSASPRVLIAVSYDRNSPRSRYESQVGGLGNLLRLLPADARIVYISTTGVYHQTDGRWVDETSPTHPTGLGGRVHLQAEQLLHSMRPFAPWNILRLAGIYGPGRVPRAADVVAGRPIASPELGFLNLIHVHDAARAVLASWDRLGQTSMGQAKGSEALAAVRPGLQSRLYVVGDDAPVVRGDFYREIAAQTHSPPPEFIAPPADAPVRMRSNSNKRVWNRKLRRELLTTLVYPDYRCGLADVLQPAVE